MRDPAFRCGPRHNDFRTAVQKAPRVRRPKSISSPFLVRKSSVFYHRKVPYPLHTSQTGGKAEGSWEGGVGGMRARVGYLMMVFSRDQGRWKEKERDSLLRRVHVIRGLKRRRAFVLLVCLSAVLVCVVCVHKPVGREIYSGAARGAPGGAAGEAVYPILRFSVLSERTERAKRAPFFSEPKIKVSTSKFENKYRIIDILRFL